MALVRVEKVSSKSIPFKQLKNQLVDDDLIEETTNTVI